MEGLDKWKFWAIHNNNLELSTKLATTERSTNLLDDVLFYYYVWNKENKINKFVFSLIIRTHDLGVKSMESTVLQLHSDNFFTESILNSTYMATRLKI